MTIAPPPWTVKPRLGDLLFVPKGSSGRWALQNKIQSKHVDFVLCAVDTMTPKLVIELDDKSHDRADRKERDDFVDKAFAAAGMEVLHVPVRVSYVLEVVRSEIKAAMSRIKSPAADRPMAGDVPICPNCRTSMVQRTASKGPQKGKFFWGCENYPNCRTTVPIR